MLFRSESKAKRQFSFKKVAGRGHFAGSGGEFKPKIIDGAG